MQPYWLQRCTVNFHRLTECQKLFNTSYDCLSDSSCQSKRLYVCLEHCNSVTLPRKVSRAAAIKHEQNLPKQRTNSWWREKIYLWSFISDKTKQQQQRRWAKANWQCVRKQRASIYGKHSAGGGKNDKRCNEMKQVLKQYFSLRILSSESLCLTYEIIKQKQVKNIKFERTESYIPSTID